MLKIWRQTVGEHLRRQPVLLPAVVIILVCLSVILHQLLQRGYERALNEQLAANVALVHAIEESITLSIQAVSGSLSSLSPQIPELSDTAILRVEKQLLHSFPQLHSIEVVPLSDAILCQTESTSTNTSKVRLLTPQDGHGWGVNVRQQSARYWPVCSPYYAEGQIKGFVVGSIDPNYYSNLLSAKEYGGKEIDVFHTSGENMLGSALPMPHWIKEASQSTAWGVQRIEKEGVYAYSESFRAAAFIPFVVTLRSYDHIDLAIWSSDAWILKWSFAVFGLVIVILMLMSFVFKHRYERNNGNNRLLSAAIRNTANAIFITDKKGKIHWINQAFTKLTGYTIQEIRGETPRILNSGCQDRRYFRDLWKTISSGKSWRGELINRDKHGGLITVNQVITPMKSEAGKIEHYIAVHEDISARKIAEEHAIFLAKHDGLTSLANRRYFEEQINERIHGYSQGLIGLIFIDLDRFKEINDTLGHEAGDILLKRTANKLQSILPDTATLARLGGDEFALFVYPLADREEMTQLAQAIVSGLETPFDYQGSKFFVTCSVGVAVNAIQDADTSTLLRQADMAMYRSKQEGRNTYRIFDSSMDEIMKHRVALQQELDEAIRTGDGLSLDFQPQVNACTGAVIGAELLFRWVRKSGERVAPEAFIPILEESGQIVALGKWIIQACCKQLHEWRQLGLDVGKTAINISTVQLSNSSVVEDLLAAMEEYAIPSETMSVELTETALMVSSATLTQNLMQLVENNITITIDDFGTGYCSLTYLKRLDAHYLKIDRSFVAGIGHNETDESIILATIAMAKGLKMDVIAEGIETQEQVDFLTQHQCDILQGYYFGEPMSAFMYQQHLFTTKNDSSKC